MLHLVITVSQSVAEVEHIHRIVLAVKDRGRCFLCGVAIGPFHLHVVIEASQLIMVGNEVAGVHLQDIR